MFEETILRIGLSGAWDRRVGALEQLVSEQLSWELSDPSGRQYLEVSSSGGPGLYTVHFMPRVDTTTTSVTISLRQGQTQLGHANCDLNTARGPHGTT